LLELGMAVGVGGSLNVEDGGGHVDTSSKKTRVQTGYSDACFLAGRARSNLTSQTTYSLALGGIILARRVAGFCRILRGDVWLVGR